MNIFYNFIKCLFNPYPLIIENHIPSPNLNLLSINPNAVLLFDQPINWNLLSINPNSVLLFDQPINWKYLFNPFPYYNYEEIKEKNKVINNHIIEDFAIKRYSPKKFINLNSPNWEKEMEEYISVYE
jgi:hypothetical protein